MKPSHTSTWEQAVNKILNLSASTSATMYNLKGVKALYKHQNDPLKNLRVIHTAGTNGKGTFCTRVAKSIELANPGMKVGLYTSPHISTVREGFQINGNLIPKEFVMDFFNFFEKMKLRDPSLDLVSYFDFKTNLAF